MKTDPQMVMEQMGVILMVKKERERPTDEMSEKNLVEALKIFDPDGNWEPKNVFHTILKIKENFTKQMPYQKQKNCLGI